MSMRSLFKNTLVYGLGNIFNRILSFLLLPLFTHYLTPSDYGIIAMLSLFQLVATSTLTLGFGTSSGILFKAADSPSGRGKVIWSSCLFLFSFGLFSATLALPLIPLTTATFCALGGALFSITTMPLTLAIQYDERATLFTILSGVGAFINLFLNVFFIVILGWGVIGWSTALFIAQIIIFIFFLIPNLRTLPIGICSSTLIQLLKLGLPLAPNAIFIFFIQQSGKYFLFEWTSAAETGLYALGFNIGIGAYLFINGFCLAWIPHILSHNGSPEEIMDETARVTGYYLRIFCGLAALCFIGSKWMLLFMVKPAFYEAHLVIGWIALGYTYLGLFNIFTTSAVISRKLFINTFSQATAMLFCALLSLFFIPQYGAIGAAVTFTLSHLFLAALQLAYTLFYALPLPNLSAAKILYLHLPLALAFTSLSSHFVVSCLGAILICLFILGGFIHEKTYLRRLLYRSVL